MNFPEKAIFRRQRNLCYTMMDFHDGDVVTFYCPAERSSTTAGYAWYTDGKDHRLVSIKELEEIKDED